MQPKRVFRHHSSLHYLRMRTSTFVALSLALLCIVSASQAAKLPSLKAQIAIRAVTGNSTDMMSGILDGMSVRAWPLVSIELSQCP